MEEALHICKNKIRTELESSEQEKVIQHITKVYQERIKKLKVHDPVRFFSENGHEIYIRTDDEGFALEEVEKLEKSTNYVINLLKDSIVADKILPNMTSALLFYRRPKDACQYILSQLESIKLVHMISTNKGIKYYVKNPNKEEAEEYAKKIFEEWKSSVSQSRHLKLLYNIFNQTYNNIVQVGEVILKPFLRNSKFYPSNKAHGSLTDEQAPYDEDLVYPGQKYVESIRELISKNYEKRDEMSGSIREIRKHVNNLIELRESNKKNKNLKKGIESVISEACDLIERVNDQGNYFTNNLLGAIANLEIAYKGWFVKVLQKVRLYNLFYGHYKL